MKNRRFFSAAQKGKAGKPKGLFLTGKTVIENEQDQVFCGITQENYVNTRFLATGIVVKMSDMHFAGLWM